VVNAPEFPEGLEWLNTERPLRIADLRGKVVLLDFWTYCCINCIHIMPDLKRLEAKYGDALVVIGVHSAKFPTEQGTENIRQAILRYGIEHAVVNDRDFRVWSEYTARAWPTLVLIDTRGKVVDGLSGEGVFEHFDGPIGELVREATAAGTLNTRPLGLTLERDRAPKSVLSFPGKVLADAAADRLFVADSSHNRVVVARLGDGTVLDVIGAGTRGLADGAFDRATFNNPQGMALDGDTLYVADTDNHAIRRVSLTKRTVETIGGTGVQAMEFNVGGVGAAVPLNSPWDLLVHKGALYVAMAGFHQIWRMDLKTWRLDPYAGSGREDRVDGPLARAALAQPSGLSTDGARLFVADSEVSAIRTVDLDPAGRVATVVGEALFEFGDQDGEGDRVRLQHPLGVVHVDGTLFVADTYNNKIKRVDPATRESRTFAGSGEGGFGDGEASAARFDEPGGLSYAAGRLYVADTNNHAVRVVDLKTRRVETFAFKGIERLMKKAADAPYSGEVVTLPEQRVAPGAAAASFEVSLPRRLKLNAEAPFYAGLGADDAAVVAVAAEAAGTAAANRVFPIRLAFTAKAGRTTLVLDTVIYYCEAGKEELCYVKQVRFRVPVRVEEGGGREVRVSYDLKK
jgi:sugar lactone lactonase YvrE/thiol-disulfide isomerase/thioredoxin